jgi:hypothetical protein
LTARDPVKLYVTVVPLWEQVTAVQPGAVWFDIEHPLWSRVAPLGMVNVTVGFVSAAVPVFLYVM